MSAAPGGKSSYCAQLMKNTGLLVCNDLKPERQKATTGNLHRLGVRNALVVSYDGRRLPQVMKGFDRVLLDAPCSGLGIVARDQSVKIQRTLKVGGTGHGMTHTYAPPHRTHACPPAGRSATIRACMH